MFTERKGVVHHMEALRRLEQHRDSQLLAGHNSQTEEEAVRDRTQDSQSFAEGLWRIWDQKPDIYTGWVGGRDSHRGQTSTG